MDGGSAINAEKLKQTFLECGICSETFNEKDQHPRLLPCLHTYCFSCLQKIIKDENVTCPYCLTKHPCSKNNLQIFPKDNTRRDLLDFVSATSNDKQACGLCDDRGEATYRCRDCESLLCNDCVKMHTRIKTYKNHYLVSLDDLSKAPPQQLANFHHRSYCSENGHESEVLKMYCSESSCKKPVCLLCAFTQHKEHDIKNIADVFDTETQKNNEVSERIQTKVTKLDIIINGILSEKDEIQNEAENQRTSLRAVFANARSMLERREQELSNEIDLLELGRLKSLETQKDSVQSHKDACLQACRFLKQSLAYKNKPAFLEISSSIFSRLTDLENTKCNETPFATAKSFYFKSLGLGLEFQSSVKDFGYVYSSEVYVENSKVEVPNNCLVAENVLFQIYLKSANQFVVDKEKVEVVIKGTNKIEDSKCINCKFSTSEGRYTGSWIPQNAGNFNWEILSNGVTLTFSNPMITVGKKPSYENVERVPSYIERVPIDKEEDKLCVEGVPSYKEEDKLCVESVPSYKEEDKVCAYKNSILTLPEKRTNRK